MLKRLVLIGWAPLDEQRLWLSSPEREQEPGGRIGVAVSAVMSPQLAQTIAEVPEAEWATFDTEPDGTLRQWAEVVYVPSKKLEHKHTQPLRYHQALAAGGLADSARAPFSLSATQPRSQYHRRHRHAPRTGLRAAAACL